MGAASWIPFSMTLACTRGLGSCELWPDHCCVFVCVNAGMRRDVEKCMRNSHVLKDMLVSAGIKTMLNELSNTVVFERPLEEAFVRKWQLACENDIAHVVVMPNITVTKLEEFVQDLVQSRARMAIAAAKRIAHTARLSEDGEMEPESSP